ncbi:3-oxoadipate--succinyl-CoA transferase subunit B [Polycladomyces abyssicola]|uniref:3-oxoadipate--succinyl-CoA transferase subunit B n=1 Tax=Polycladomyces abyssicola TaxID=1125966 RepID=A0A8D5UDP4_9BACL|nr:CoA-transferase [Polycladomyces abyssicola]BCU80586.1 3-oxoadipate--succinyl-CoA transferase subunit B [Polycladomyces abyssicola]
MEYTTEELMVVAAAREIRDSEIVFVGMRLPMLAFCVAKRLHAPNAIGFFECGIVRDEPPEELLYTMGDPANIAGASWCTSTNNLMFLMQQGLIDIGFIGGAEIDQYGNVNTSYLGDYTSPKVKLPGSGGAADIACLSNRLMVIMPHEKRRLVKNVNYITSPGYGTGPGWRQETGLPRGGIKALITNLGILRADKVTKVLIVDTIHPGISKEQIIENTGWDIQFSPDCSETPPPTEEELEVLRSIDPKGFWTKRQTSEVKTPQ